MGDNRVISPYAAFIDGKTTGLAGCNSAHECSRSEFCLRADPTLSPGFRIDAQPKDCLQFIRAAAAIGAKGD